MMSVFHTRSREATPSFPHGSQTRSTEDAARALIRDLLSPNPTYDLHAQDTGTYSQLLGTVVRVRQGSGGLEAAKRTLDDMKARHPAFAQLLQEPRVTTSDQPEANIPQLPKAARLPIGLLPHVSPWLTQYVEYSRRMSPEGYDDFHLGCGVWVLSTAAARRVYVPLADPVYTPVAIAMVARTSLFAKTTTAKAALKVLQEAHLDWLLGDDETTPSARCWRIWQDMSPPTMGRWMPKSKPLSCVAWGCPANWDGTTTSSTS